MAVAAAALSHNIKRLVTMGDVQLDDFERVLLSTSTLDRTELLDLKAIFRGVSVGSKVTAAQAAHTLAQLGYTLNLEEDGSVGSLPSGRLTSLDEQEFLQVASRCSEDLSHSSRGSGSDKEAEVLFRMLSPHGVHDHANPAQLRDFMGCAGVHVTPDEAERYCKSLSRRGESMVSKSDLMHFTAKLEARHEASI